MSRRNDIKKLIETHSRNLQKLKEKEASFGGLHTPPHILTAIDDTVTEIEGLQSELRELEKTSDLPLQDASPTSAHIQKKRSGLFWIATHAIVLIFGIVIGILVMVLIPTRIQTPASISTPISTPISTSIPQRLSPITINIKHNRDYID